MAMVVKNNMGAVRTLNTLNKNNAKLEKSLGRVSSGMKINSAQDDASGYGISERMRVRLRALDQANQNTQNDSSMMKTAEGAVGNTVEILRSLKEKAINAANDSNTDEDRQTIQKEIDQLIDQIDDNALVQFNGKYLVDGSKNNAFTDTKTILLNQYLAKGTGAYTALTDMANRAGDSLGIQTSDRWQVSWVENGNIHTSSGEVKDQANLATILEKAGFTSSADGAKGVIAATGEDGRIDQLYLDKKYVNTSDTVNISNSSFTDDGSSNPFSDDGLVLPTAVSDSVAIPLGYYGKVGGSSDNYVQVSGKITCVGPSGNGTKYTLEFDCTFDDPLQELCRKNTPEDITTDATIVSIDPPDKSRHDVYTPDKGDGLAIIAKDAGVNNQISGFTISIMDQDGNVKKEANAALNQFKQYQRAENQTEDMSLNFHIGSEANQAIKIAMGDMRSQSLGLKGSDGTKINVCTRDNANAAISVIENALTIALDQQTTIGAIEARLEYTSANLTTSSENVQAAESTIRDADMAKEMTEYTKDNVLLQSAQAMLAQANQNSSAVLSLLQ